MLSESPAQVKSMTIDTSGGLTGSVLNNVALSSGCAPKSMSYLKDENFIVTGCSDGSGKTSTLKIEADGSLTLKDTSVVGGMKIDSIVFVTF